MEAVTGDKAAAEDLSERVAEIEKSVKRAVEAIALLRREREALLARVKSMEADRGELSSLKQERREVLAQVDSILKELDKLDL
jgi:FtsZ-binding cell division protein ZapB